MRPYADSNFFTRVYFEMDGSAEAAGLLAASAKTGAPPLPLIWLHRFEVLNAFFRHAFLGREPGALRITEELAGVAMAAFHDDLDAAAFVEPADLSPQEIAPIFEELMLRHTARHGFRTYDLLHVASALALGCDAFWSFDAKASKLAKLEGLDVR